jgi:23S rRNA (adenine2503-C2)-methyltransferase
MSNPLLGLNINELGSILKEMGQPAYRSIQLAEWIYQRGARTFAEMTNLPHTLRDFLQEKYKIGRSTIINIQRGKDSTIKLLLEMQDGERVETVGLPYTAYCSCCLSTQVGCSIGCSFCATGLTGFVRNLTPGEIVDQLLTVRKIIQEDQLECRTSGCTVDHAIFMGMGEPLLNYDATIKAINLLNKEIGISMRHLTLSTAGYVPGIVRLMKEQLQITLAVSLHGPTDELRQKLVPGMSKYSIPEIIESCRMYVLETGRRVTFEYCLIDTVNDSPAEANELAKILNGINCHVNLITYNKVAGLSFNASSRNNIRNFREILESSGIQVTQRLSRGYDIDAACGQLRQRLTPS